MKYVILETGGKQYKVEEGSVISVEKLPVEIDTDYTFDKILFFSQDGTIQLGHPHLTDVVVTGHVMEQKKGEKIRVAKFKAKSRYRRVTGHRQLITTVKIGSIAGPAVKAKTSAEQNPSTKTAEKTEAAASVKTDKTA
jgi:large subunit ribosomal protein L21